MPENYRNTKNIVAYLEKIVGESIAVKNNPMGEEVTIRKCKNSTEIQKKLSYDIQEPLKDQRIASDQILIITNSEKSESSIVSLTKIGYLPIKSLDNKARMDQDSINYTSINTFKGLEIDMVLMLDIHLISIEERKKVLYTEGSRAKHKLYTYEVKS